LNFNIQNYSLYIVLVVTIPMIYKKLFPFQSDAIILNRNTYIYISMHNNISYIVVPSTVTDIGSSTTEMENNKYHTINFDFFTVLFNLFHVKFCFCFTTYYIVILKNKPNKMFFYGYKTDILILHTSNLYYKNRKE
jgi:hypothetical protein